MRIRASRARLRIEVIAGSFDARLTQTIAHMSRLDEDLSPFYELVRDDDLSWCATGAKDAARADRVRRRRQDDVNVHTIFDAMDNAARPWLGDERHRCSQTIRKIRGPLEGGPLIGQSSGLG